MNDLQIQATLYCLHRKQLYVDYMRGAKLLAAYGLGTNPSSNQAWLPNPSSTDSMAPDCCSNCGSVFGTTIGGRLRDRCYDCRSSVNAIHPYEVQCLAMMWGCSQEYVEYLLSTAIAHCTARGLVFPAPFSFPFIQDKYVASESETALTL